MSSWPRLHISITLCKVIFLLFTHTLITIIIHLFVDIWEPGVHAFMNLIILMLLKIWAFLGKIICCASTLSFWFLQFVTLVRRQSLFGVEFDHLFWLKILFNLRYHIFKLIFARFAHCNLIFNLLLERIYHLLWWFRRTSSIWSLIT
jgi:hypothetical protein